MIILWIIFGGICAGCMLFGNHKRYYQTYKPQKKPLKGKCMCSCSVPEVANIPTATAFCTKCHKEIKD